MISWKLLDKNHVIACDFYHGKNSNYLIFQNELLRMKKPNANLSGILNLVRASNNPLTPIFEAITNSLESISESETSIGHLIEIVFFFIDIDNDFKVLDSIEIIDTGCGFNESSLKRFKSVFDDSKGFKNRGSGRIQFFHRFSDLQVESSYKEQGETFIRKFRSNLDNFIFDEKVEKVQIDTISTRITLTGFKARKKDSDFFNGFTIKKAKSLIKTQYALRAYLDRKNNSRFPDIKLKFINKASSIEEEITLTEADFPEPVNAGEFSIPYVYPKFIDGDISKIEWLKDLDKTPELFKWIAFEFPSDSIDEQGAFLCSKNIPVEKIVNPIIKKSNELGTAKKIVAFYGDYLDITDNVTQSVDRFNIKSKNEVDQVADDFFNNNSYVYIDDIKREVSTQLELIYNEIFQAKINIERRVHLLAKELGISSDIAKIVNRKVRLNETDDNITIILHSELGKIIAEKSNQARVIIKQLDSLDPTSKSYNDDLIDKSNKLSLIIDDQNKEELTKYIVRRELVVKMLDRIVCNGLNIQSQTLPKGKKRDKEGIVHDLFFKRKSSSQINDLWLLDEEFIYYHGFSDIEISKIQLPDGKPLLLPEAIENMKSFGFKPNQRPDVYLYANQGKCIIIEFKAPDVDLSDYLNQMPKYCNLLANYSSVKLEKFYCYLIGETIAPWTSLNDYEKSISGSWYRDSVPIRNIDENDRRTIANMRIEILTLSDISKRAKARNHSFAEKLGLHKIINQ